MNASESPDKAVSVEINELLQVRIADDDCSLTYASRVDDLVGGRVVLSWPTDGGVRLPVRERQNLALSFVRQDSAYSFDAVVEERRQTPLPQLVVRPGGMPERVQRRQYFRVKAMLPVELTGRIVPAAAAGTRDNLVHIKTRTYDISGSGMAIWHTSSMPAGTVLDTKLILQGELPPVKAVSKVLYSRPVPSEKVEYHIGMHFVAISEPDRTRIVRQVFRLQQVQVS